MKACPICESPYGYFTGNNSYTCPECSNKWNLKNTENEAQIIKKEDLDQHNSRGIYMRDDHCDWGSSGMNDLIKSLDDNN